MHRSGLLCFIVGLWAVLGLSACTFIAPHSLVIQPQVERLPDANLQFSNSACTTTVLWLFGSGSSGLEGAVDGLKLPPKGAKLEFLTVDTMNTSYLLWAKHCTVVTAHYAYRQTDAPPVVVNSGVVKSVGETRVSYRFTASCEELCSAYSKLRGAGQLEASKAAFEACERECIRAPGSEFTSCVRRARTIKQLRACGSPPQGE